MVDYLDPEIANEGESANNWSPGAWTNAPPTSDDEWQPDIEPPHIPDYSAFKKHKHYRQYFRPYRYVPFPAWMYHATQEPKIVKSAEEVQKLGPDWSREPIVRKIDMTGKSLPVKSETQRLAEVVAQALAAKQGTAPIDANAIAAVVTAVMAAIQPSQKPAKVAAPDPEALMPDASDGLHAFVENPPAEDEKSPEHDGIERKALLELAEKEGVKVDGRWSNKRLKEALGIV